MEIQMLFDQITDHFLTFLGGKVVEVGPRGGVVVGVLGVE